MDLSNKLFFIQYTPENTMRRRWYLIQVDMQSTREVNADFVTNGEYWCVFLSRHPHDEKKVTLYVGGGQNGIGTVAAPNQMILFMGVEF